MERKISPVIHNKMFDDEYSLHRAVVIYINKYHADAIMTGEFISLIPTQEKRNLAYKRGYMTGTPDLLILNQNKKYRGLAI